MLVLNHLASLAARHLVGLLAYTILSPAIVSFAVLILGTAGFWLVAGGINEQDGIARIIVQNVAGIADGRWIEWAWRRDLTFEQNALRIFGMVGLAGWILDLAVGLVRGNSVEVERPPLPTRLVRVLLRLGVAVAALCLALLAAVLLAPRAPHQGSATLWVVQALATAGVMAVLLYVITAPSIGGWYLLNQLRPEVGRLVEKIMPPHEPPPPAPNR